MPARPRLEHPDPLLRDDAVLLRPWAPADLPGLLAGFGDPVVQRWSWPLTTPYTARDAERFLHDQEQGRLEGEELQWAVVDPAAPGSVLGGASLYGLAAEPGRGAVGYWLAPGGRGRGLATRAVRLVAGWAFDRLGLSLLELTCSPDNAASARVAERAGFVLERLLVADLPFRGRLRDSLLHVRRPAQAGEAAPTSRPAR